MSFNFFNPGYLGALTTPKPAISDPDAARYVDKVEKADDEPLGGVTVAAIVKMVTALKNQGYWNRLHKILPYCGARTLAGATEPLMGTAATNYNLSESDYDRRVGVLGDGISKFMALRLKNHKSDNFSMFCRLSSDINEIPFGHDVSKIFIYAGIQSYCYDGQTAGPETAFPGGTVGVTNYQSNHICVGAAAVVTTRAATISQNPRRYATILSQSRGINFADNMGRMSRGRAAFFVRGDAFSQSEMLGLKVIIDSYFADLAAIDFDADDYIAAVEKADKQPLENAVKIAINTYIKDIKAIPGVWEGIRILAPMSAARTLAGAAIPLKGTIPFTFTNVTSADYNRTNGLKHTKNTMSVAISNSTYAMAGPNIEVGTSFYMTVVPSAGQARVFYQGGNVAPMLEISFDKDYDKILCGVRANIDTGGGWGFSPGMNYAGRINTTQVRYKFSTGAQGNATVGSNAAAVTPTTPIQIHGSFNAATNYSGICFAVDTIGSSLIDNVPFRDATIKYYNALVAANLT